jgi:hypothetical protein
MYLYLQLDKSYVIVMLSRGLNFFAGLNLPQSAASKIFIFFFTLLICIYFKQKIYHHSIILNHHSIILNFIAS